MSDDESEVVYMRRTNANVLHYGSLENKEKQRLQDGSTAGSMAADAIQAGISAGNINISAGRNKLCDVKYLLLVCLFESRLKATTKCVLFARR